MTAAVFLAVLLLSPAYARQRGAREGGGREPLSPCSSLPRRWPSFACLRVHCTCLAACFVEQKSERRGEAVFWKGKKGRSRLSPPSWTTNSHSRPLTLALIHWREGERERECEEQPTGRTDGRRLDARVSCPFPVRESRQQKQRRRRQQQQFFSFLFG